MTSPDDATFNLSDFVNAEAWLDPQFKAELEADPDAAMDRLRDKYGIDIPKDIKYKVVSDTDEVCHVVLSANPSGAAPAELGSEVQAYAAQFVPLSGAGGGTRCTSAALICHSPACQTGTRTNSCIKAAF